MGDPPTGTVTFLFTDIEGSTRLWEERPDEMRAALTEHDALVRAAIDAHGGYVFSTGGDGFAAAFSRAADAVDAAQRAQAALAGLALIKVRMGIHTGEVQERDGDYFGPAVNRAARVMTVSHGGQVVLSQATRELLRDGVVIDLGEHRLRDLSGAARLFQLGDGSHPQLRSIDASLTNLPLQLNEIVGRDDDIAAIAASLREHRVVTLTGVGGVGKTRLAVQVAAELVADFVAGAWLVELASVVDDNAVAGAVAAALGVQQRQGMSMVDSLVDYLRLKDILVVLDNCEHVLEGAAELVDSVATACADVRFLVTSREALSVSGEWVQRVPSLALPPVHAGTRAVRGVASVELFITRVSASGHPLHLDDATSATVVEIVRRLDGIPLALELAAARVGSLGVAQVAAHLDERFRLLTGVSRTKVERHRTLRSAVQWSFDLLSAIEQMAFARMSVFAGGFTIDAAVAVIHEEQVGELRVLEIVSSLVSKSMVVAEHRDGDVRYRMLETLRQFGQEHLQASGEADAVRARHASFFADFADVVEPGLCGPDEATWVARVEQDMENFRAAFDWAADVGDVDVAFRVASAMGRYGWGRPATGALVLPSRAVELPEADENRLFAWVAGWASYAAYIHGDTSAVHRIAALAEASATQTGGQMNPWVCATLGLADLQAGGPMWREQLTRVVGVARASGSRVDLAVHLGALWAHTHQTGRPIDNSLAHDAMEIARSTENPSAIALTLMETALAFPDDEALVLLEEAMALSEAVGNVMTLAYALRPLGDVQLQLGQPHNALASAQRALALLSQSGNRQDIQWLFDMITRALIQVGQEEAAATLLGAVLAGPFAYSHATIHQSARDELAARLGGPVLASLLDRGRSMSIDQLVALANQVVESALSERDRSADKGGYE